MTVNITDKAIIANETQRSRDVKGDFGITDFLGSKTIKTPANRSAARPSAHRRFHLLKRRQRLLSIAQEALQTNVAAVVTQVLPNGNLVVEGKPGDSRQLRNPRIDRRRHRAAGGYPERQHHRLSKIAQARIAYGGRGQFTDVQQQRYGQQFFDVILPF